MLLQNLPRDLFAGQSRLALHRAIDAGASEAAVAALLAAFPELAAVTGDRVRDPLGGERSVAPWKWMHAPR